MNIRRRRLLVALALAPVVARAQQPARIAWLGSGTERGSAMFFSAFKQGLRENGLVEGTHYILDARYSDGHYDRFPALVDELLQRNPSVIMVQTTASVRAAQRVTKTVPIVMMAANDPVGSGLIASLARPGGNTTGLGSMAEDVSPKYVELLRELLPQATRLAVLVNPSNPTNATIFEKISAAARTHGVGAQAVEVSSPDVLTSAFDNLARQRPDALAVASDFMFHDQLERISELTLKHRVPAFGPTPEYAETGCLLGVGTSRREMFRRSATYVAKILRGAKPGDLPVEQPTRFEVVLNAKTAKAIGVTVPQSILLRADRVIE